MRIEPLGAEEPSHTVMELLRGDAASIEALRAAVRNHPCGVLVAREHGAPRAVLWGRLLPSAYLVQGIAAESESFATAVPAFIEHLASSFPGQRLEARFEGRTRGERALHQALTNASAKIALEQRCYERELSELPSAEPPPFTLHSYAEVGKAGLVALLASIFSGGPSGCVTSDPHEEAERMLFLARDEEGRPDTSHWGFAFLNGMPIGLALGALHGEAPRYGTLLYSGLVPWMRGRRLGAALHAVALRRLAAAGATHYRDATTGANAAMRRIFQQSGCRESGVILHYVLRQPLASGHLSDTDALAAYLRAEHHRVDIIDGARLRTEAVCEGEVARVELTWDVGARAVHVMHHRASPLLPGQLATALRAAARLNASLTLGGFVVDEDALTAGVRVALLLDEAGHLRVAHLRRALAEVVRGARVFEAALEAHAPSGTKGGSLLERVSVSPTSRASPRAGRPWRG